MTRQECCWLITPSLAIWIFAALMGPSPRWAATIAVLLTLPPSWLTFWWVRKLQRTRPRGVVLAMMAAKLLKIVVALGGGCVITLSSDRASANGPTLWLGIAVAYLSTLTVEVFLLARPGWLGASIGSQKG